MFLEIIAKQRMGDKEKQAGIAGFRLSKKYDQGGIGGRSPLMEIRPSDMRGGAEGLA